MKHEKSGTAHIHKEKTGQKEDKIQNYSKQRSNTVTGSRHHPQYRDHVWRYDFITLQTPDSRTIRVLNIIDEYTREYLRIIVKTHITSQDVIDQLFSLFLCRGVPKFIRAANGPEFTANAIRDWLDDLGVKIRFIEPESPPHKN